MKKAVVLLALLVAASAAEAQMKVRSTSSGFQPSDRGGFRIGPRYSNYATDVDMGIVTVETGRQHAFGLVGEYRSGAFIFDFNFDHDPENGLQLTDLLPFDLGNYERDRVEVTVGWSALSVLDLQAGVRFDSFSVGETGFGGLFADEQFDHTALVVGLHAHTPTRRPFGLYGIARAMFGTVDFEDGAFSAQADSTGWRFEGGVEIPIGESNWHAVPGIEFERIEADPRVTVETNRFFVNVVYTFPR